MSERPTPESQRKRFAVLLLCCTFPFVAKGAEHLAGNIGFWAVMAVVFLAMYVLTK